MGGLLIGRVLKPLKPILVVLEVVLVVLEVVLQLLLLQLLLLQLRVLLKLPSPLRRGGGIWFSASGLIQTHVYQDQTKTKPGLNQD